MRQLSRRLRALVAHRDRGATAAEYALLITFVAAAIIVAVTFFGTQLSAVFNQVASQITGNQPPGTN